MKKTLILLISTFTLGLMLVAIISVYGMYNLSSGVRDYKEISGDFFNKTTEIKYELTELVSNVRTMFLLKKSREFDEVKESTNGLMTS